jgi:hypothetical protein
VPASRWRLARGHTYAERLEGAAEGGRRGAVARAAGTHVGVVIHAPSPGSGFGACGLGAESARRIVDRDASCQSRRATFYPRRRVAGGQVESV